MKTALDLPDDLVKEIKYRAIRDGKKLKDEMAFLLRRGLDASDGTDFSDQAVIGQDGETGLPLIMCSPRSTNMGSMTPADIAEILLEQETLWNHEADR